MINIALIGSGELGSRHLQSLVGIINANITVVEPSFTSIEITRQRILDLNLNELADVSFVDDIKMLPSKIDFAVIATGAAPRLSILKSLLKHTSVKYLLLEKVLFQSIEDYAEAKELIDSNDVKVWVNCPRRMFEFYASLKMKLNKASPMVMKVNGSNWGLACNAIHFIDIFSFLTDSKVLTVTTDELEQKIYPSKREGYIEIFGCLNVTFQNGHKLIMNCSHDEIPMDINITSIDGEYEVNETKGHILHNGEQKSIDVLIKYQSELSRLVAEEALAFGQSKLTDFDEACEQHIPLINSLLSFYNRSRNIETSILPIT
jgi:predicted dehydrogenase